jgi:hypothetical protein
MAAVRVTQRILNRRVQMSSVTRLMTVREVAIMEVFDG